MLLANNGVFQLHFTSGKDYKPLPSPHTFFYSQCHILGQQTLLASNSNNRLLPDERDQYINFVIYLNQKQENHEIKGEGIRKAASEIIENNGKIKEKASMLHCKTLSRTHILFTDCSYVRQ